MYKFECLSCGKEQWPATKEGQCINCGAEGMLQDIEWGEEEEKDEDEI